LLILLMVTLGLRLFDLTVLENDRWASAAQAISVKNLTVSAPRGEIRDRYGRLLAGNQFSFVVQFSEGNFDDEELNSQALLLMDILEENGEEIEDSFPIVLGEGGTFYYTYQRSVEEWLASMEMPVTYTAEQAFKELRNRYGIDPELDVYDAQLELQNTYNIYPPISVRVMKFTETLNLESFLGRYEASLERRDYDYTVSARDAFAMLRQVYEIDESLTNADARKIILVRDALSAQGYLSYVPITVAKNISEESIVTIEERSMELSAVDVVTEYVRYYPNGSTASHILGYLGKISESEKAEYLAKGYSVTDLVGKDGIEKAYEDVLKGTDGVKSVEVNVYGQLVQVLDETEEKKGETVYLTIDLELQKTMEEALDQALEEIQTGGLFESEYGNYDYGRAYPNATVGAAVAIEVETGDVLAMASAPDFDPNLFAEGINSADWNSLQAQNTRDPLSPRPLYNVAARTAVQPGSSFKLVTGLAALEAGLNPNARYQDGAYIAVGNRTYGCVLWNLYGGRHGALNLFDAIEVSCNYYFYNLISNKDWYTGAGLGLDDSMGIELVMEYAEQFGFGQPTGIEIPETVQPLPSAERKMSSTIASLKSVLKARANTYFTERALGDDQVLAETISTIANWARENPTRGTIIKRLQEMPVKEDQVETVADLCKYSYFNMANWTLGDYFNISIGQGENAYTPLQVANMVATIGNEGKRNEVSVVYAVGDERTEKEEPVQVEVSDDKYFDDLIKGMTQVAHNPGGSGYGMFWNFPVTVGAKTGTAERSGKIQPADEVEYIKSNLYRINGRLTWQQVETEMQRLLREESDTYTSTTSAVRQAVINLSNGTVNAATLDYYKKDYDNFAWFVAMAPAEDPQIAVAVLIFNGGTGGYAGPVAREVIGKYLELNTEYEDFTLTTVPN
ncbi:MAG: penicillin-binding protein, partial [Firmicutes bacterium]|nr:penicillin-binding protein [Bacillota bacterium]